MATEQRQDVATSWRTAGTAADLLVAEESMAGLGSAAATATATATATTTATAREG